MTIETIRLSQSGKDHLVSLKRKTKMRQWNELCRWGLCVSLAEPGTPPPSNIPADSNVEMNWRVFGGRHAGVYLVLLRMRLRQDGLPLDDETLARQFRLHLHRGLSYLAGLKSLRSIDDLVRLAIDQEPSIEDGECSEIAYAPEAGTEGA